MIEDIDTPFETYDIESFVIELGNNLFITELQDTVIKSRLVGKLVSDKPNVGYVIAPEVWHETREEAVEAMDKYINHYYVMSLHGECSLFISGKYASGIFEYTGPSR